MVSHGTLFCHYLSCSSPSSGVSGKLCLGKAVLDNLTYIVFSCAFGALRSSGDDSSGGQQQLGADSFDCRPESCEFIVQ